MGDNAAPDCSFMRDCEIGSNAACSSMDELVESEQLLNDKRGKRRPGKARKTASEIFFPKGNWKFTRGFPFIKLIVKCAA